MELNKLPQTLSENLLGQPETGMGYQIIKDASSTFFLVLNTTLSIPLFPRKYPIPFLRPSNDEMQYLTGDPDSEAIRHLEEAHYSGEIEVVSDEFWTDLILTWPPLGMNSMSAPSHESYFPQVRFPGTPPPLVGGSPESYYRYSAYSKDKRIDANGDFKPETYATTFNDMHFVPSGYAAVGRYALMNPASACFLFHIVTTTIPTFVGTATPKFGQAGGGVEVFFKNGAKHLPGTGFLINVG